ncbi:MAG: hypothetical protein ACXVQ3_09405, partial [Gaiellaceae bacterium]
DDAVGVGELARAAARGEQQLLPRVVLTLVVGRPVRVEVDGDEPPAEPVLVALAVNGVPIDVLAERLDSNRNALYKTLHDARRPLRAHLAAGGFTGGW